MSDRNFIDFDTNEYNDLQALATFLQALRANGQDFTTERIKARVRVFLTVR